MSHKRRCGRERKKRFRWSLLGVILSLFLTAAQSGAATIVQDGSIVTGKGTVVPPLPQPGRWTEFEAKSSDTYDIRHFRYMVPHGSPAMELFVATNKRGEVPDGAFEIGLVRGFIRGFGSKAGFTYEEPVFEGRAVADAKTLHASVQLSNGPRTFWMYAYICLGSPSLTFIAVAGKGGTEEGIERYLSQVKVR